MTDPYAWIIDTDCAPDLSYPEGTNCNAKGRTGPRNADPEYLQLLQSSKDCGIEFRLCYDEDPRDPSYVAYYGRIFFGPDIAGIDDLSEDAFAPLDGFGKPNAGCGTIEYRTAKGTWQAI